MGEKERNLQQFWYAYNYILYDISRSYQQLALVRKPTTWILCIWMILDSFRFFVLPSFRFPASVQSSFSCSTLAAFFPKIIIEISKSLKWENRKTTKQTVSIPPPP